MHSINQYQDFFLSYLSAQSIHKEPKNLYAPIRYILSLEGKRIRPVLTLMVAEVFNTDYKIALPAAMAVEIFHNFSLVHDDIMDDAPLRRGNKAVHQKWNINTGILSGDTMLVLAYQYFEKFEPHIFYTLAKLFSKTALQVCEGQQWDIDFEKCDDVTIPKYIKMIEYKTAVLVGAAMQMGAIVAETSEENGRLIYDFGLNLGIAFQLQDDYLDVFGDSTIFGKQLAGDIIENKKTYLYLKALENADKETQIQLLHLYSVKLEDNYNKINTVKTIFKTSGSSDATQKAVKEYTQKAFDTLDKLDIEKERKEMLRAFGKNLMKRNV